MLTIRIKDQFLNLSADASISFDLHSPAYLGDEVDVIQGSYSFPFSVPLDSHNRKVLGFPDRLDIDIPLLVDEKAEVWSNGRLLFSGLATIKSTTRTSLKMVLIVSVLSELKGKKMNAFNFETVAIGNDLATVFAHMKDTAVNPENHNYVFFPVWNPTYSRDDNINDHSRKEFINFWKQSTQNFQSGLDNIGWIPFLKLSYVLKKSIESLGYAFTNSFQSNTELLRLVLYNNYSITEDVNIADSIDLNNHVNPDTEFTTLLRQVCRLFCLAPFSNIFNKTIRLAPLKDLLLIAPRHDWTDKAHYDYVKTEEINYPVKLSYQDMLDTAPTDDHKGEIKTYDFRTDDIINFVLPVPYARATVYFYPDDALWSIDINDTPQRQFIQNFAPTHDTGIEGSEVFESKLETMFIGAIQSPDNTATWLTPHLGEKGTYFQIVNPFQDRLIFYRGMQKMRLTNDLYPMASNNTYDSELQPAEIPGLNYSLLWDGDKGMFNVWWKTWLEMLKNKRDLEIKLLLSESDIINFNFDDKIRIQNQNYFVKKLAITITQNGFKPVKANLVSVN